jgi:septal ring factor EnvC (AmiA/AmiB activator)
MKTPFLKISLIALLSGVFVSACNSPAENLIIAKDKSVEANTNLEQANEEYEAEINQFKFEMAEKIEANDKSIADFKARIAQQKTEAKEDYQKKIAELEQKNTDNKKRMDDYKASGKENWAKFKSEFTRDMEELGNAFSDLAVNNVK